jgi:hypothetical protein
MPTSPPKRSPHNWLVYSSAGDRADIASWACGPRQFDVLLSYYGDQPGRFADLADGYEERQGSKFRNLWEWHRRDPERFAAYDAVLIIDDDLALSADQIGELFRIRERYDLWVLQPSFSPRGKLSWDVTRQRPRCELRFTNFVESGAPLFAADQLWSFFDVYDGSLTGYGIDHWYLHSMAALDNPRRVAVVDAVVTRNPTNRQKGGHREIDRAQTPADRLADWDRVRARYGILTYPPATTGRVLWPAPQQIRRTVVALPDLLYGAAVRRFGRGRRRASRHRFYRWLRTFKHHP